MNSTSTSKAKQTSTLAHSQIKIHIEHFKKTIFLQPNLQFCVISALCCDFLSSKFTVLCLVFSMV